MIRRRRPRAGSPTAAAGTTLIELILAVLMLGTSTVTILGAFGTLIKTSDLTRKTGDAGSTLAAVADAVADNGRNPYDVSCGMAPPYNPPYNPIAGVTLPGVPGSMVVEISSVQYWNGTTFAAACYDAAVPAWRVQLIEIQLDTSDGRVHRTIHVVKRG